MINQMYLLKQAYKDNTMSHAALSNENKAALLHCKENFMKQLKNGDLIEGTLVKIEGKLFLKELHTGVLFLTSLNEHDLIGQLVQWQVNGIEDNQLLLTIKDKSLTQKSLTTRVLEELGFSSNEELKEVIEGFTRFQLPLIKESIAKTFILTQVTKLPIEVLLNILQHYESSSIMDQQLAYKGIDKYELTGFEKNIDDLLNDLGEMLSKQETNKEKYLIKCLNLFNEVLPKEMLEESIHELYFSSKDDIKDTDMRVKTNKEFDQVIKLILDGEISLQDVLKKWLKASIHLPLEHIKETATQGETLKASYLFKEEEILQKIIKAIKAEMPLSHTVEKTIKQLEEQLTIVQKLKEEGHYYTFPLMSELGEAKGKVYFYKPHKQKSYLDKSLYTVIDLEMPTLKRVEVHIYQQDKTLQIGFYLEQEKIKTILEKEGYKLALALQGLGYSIKSMSYAKKVKKNEFIVEKKNTTASVLKSFDYQL